MTRPEVSNDHSRAHDNKDGDEVNLALVLPDIRSSGKARAQRHAGLNALQRPVLSADEAFRLLGVDRTTGYRAIREGTFPVPIVLRLLNPPETDADGAES
jgi:transcriptional regulator of acetoin/glycerol metabolism